MEFHIKNMVCPRCERAVRRIFNTLELPVTHLELGLVRTVANVELAQLEGLRTALRTEGFELVDNPQQRLVNRIKSFVTRYLDQRDPRTFSDALRDHLHLDYGHLSKQFSQSEGRTVEQYIIAQRVARAKELLQLGELSMGEIADRLGYRTNSHFSAQFKQHTGLSPTQYRKSLPHDRQSLDEV